LLFLAAMDLPGLGSFAGEFTILIGVFLSNAWFATLAALVTIVAAWYMVRWFQGIFHGTVGTQVDDDEERSELATPYEFPVRAPRISVDLRKFEWAVLVPIAAVIVWLGVIPKPVTDRTASSVAALTRTLAANRHTSISVAAPVPGSQGGNAGRDSVLVVKTRRVDHTPTNHGGAR